MYSIQQCDNVCQWLATGRWFSPGTPVSSNNKTDRHDIAEILLVSLNTLITLYECIYWRILEGECTFCIQWRFVVWRYFLIFWVQFINVFLGENLIRIYLVYIHFAFLVLNMLLRIILEKTSGFIILWRAATSIMVAPYIYWLTINACYILCRNCHIKNS